MHALWPRLAPRWGCRDLFAFEVVEENMSQALVQSRVHTD